VIDRLIDHRLVACAVASVIGHFVIARALEELPPRSVEPPVRATIEVRVVAPPAPPPPPEAPPQEPAKPEPIAKPVHERPRVRPVRPAVRTESPAQHDAPVTAPSANADPAAKPVFGVTMESTSQAGQTAAPVGNTTQPQPPGTATTAPRPLAVAAAHEVTKLPLPQGRCAGKYTEAARAAAIEGTVVLDLVVDESGRTREIQVIEGLGHGLTEAAIAALRGCHFTPGERDGKPVPVRIRSFKIRFLLQDG
jgi:protein TonB